MRKLVLALVGVLAIFTFIRDFAVAAPAPAPAVQKAEISLPTKP